MTTLAPDPHGDGGEAAYPPLRYESLTVAELARRCHEESQRYWRRQPYDERPGRELFRRAVVDGSDAAWAALCAHYADVVRRWLALPASDDDLVAATFERFWRAVDAEKFGHFTSLAAILNYLKACAYSVRADRLRAARVAGVATTLDDAAPALPALDDVAETVCASAEGAGVWAMVREALPDERERRIAYLSYVAGLTPREIYARRRAEFTDVAEIYRLKRTTLYRLQRTPGLRELAAAR